MQNPQPLSVYDPAALRVGARGTVVSITWTVASRTRTGKDHTVIADPRDGAIVGCTCEAGQYGKSCWHRLWAADGRAGKPRVRYAPRPAIVVPAPRPAPSLSADDIYGSDTDRTALDRRLAGLRGAA